MDMGGIPGSMYIRMHSINAKASAVMARYRYLVMHCDRHNVWHVMSPRFAKKGNAKIFADGWRIRECLAENDVKVRRVLSIKHKADDDWAVSH